MNKVKNKYDVERIVEFLLSKKLIQEEYDDKTNSHIYELTKEGKVVFYSLKVVFESNHFVKV